MNNTRAQPLTSALKIVLTQAETLERRLDESKKIIEDLRAENDRLNQQLKALRRDDKQKEKEQLDFTSQLNGLFRRDAQRQAEIDDLKARLAQKSDREPHHPQVSPASQPSEDEQTPVMEAQKRKRVKVDSKEQRPLRDIFNSSSRGRRSIQRLNQKDIYSDRGAEAIHFLAEDGSDQNGKQRQSGPKEYIDSGAAPHQRLQSLLTRPSASPVLVPKPPLLGNAPEDDEPLRSRPVQRLNLSHFKPNPVFIPGHDLTLKEDDRSNYKKKSYRSEDELLRQFLGPGSESRISMLTPLARANLLHEARAKKLLTARDNADRPDFGRQATPPSFWDVEIASTQEQRKNREQAKLKEREEVEWRYHEAMKDGRWLFVDE